MRLVGELLGLLEPDDGIVFDFYPVRRLVNDVHKDVPELPEPLAVTPAR